MQLCLQYWGQVLPPSYLTWGRDVFWWIRSLVWMTVQLQECSHWHQWQWEYAAEDLEAWTWISGSPLRTWPLATAPVFRYHKPASPPPEMHHIKKKNAFLLFLSLHTAQKLHICSVFFPQTLRLGHRFKNEETHCVAPGTGWTSSAQMEFCFWLRWGWPSARGSMLGTERMSWVRMDIWRTGSGKTSTSCAAACLGLCGLQACQHAAGMGAASWGKSGTLHIQSCHMVPQMTPTWPALTGIPAWLRLTGIPLGSEPSRVCAGRAGPFGHLQKQVRNELETEMPWDYFPNFRAISSFGLVWFFPFTCF